MLPRPSILKIPNISSAYRWGLDGCGSGYSSSPAQLQASCDRDFSCSPLGGDCIDATNGGGGCGWELGIGIGQIVITIIT